MAGVRLLVGTAKGAFVLRADEGRQDWQVQGPLFGGWEVFHLAGSPVDPDRIYASQAGGWFGQVIQRSDDGGRNWNPVDNEFTYAGEVGTHQFFDGTDQPWRFQKVWHLEPSLTDADVLYAGVEDAALFRSNDGGGSWSELPGLRTHPSGEQWQPGAGGLCLHTILLDPDDDQRIVTAISAAGVFVSDDGGARWTEISGDLPTDFGFAIDVHAHQPETVFVVPILSDSEHYPPDGALKVYRSRTGGGEWEPLTDGLPQQHCYVNVLRDAMAVDTLDDCGVYIGTTGGQVFASADGGDHWSAVVEHLPRVLSVEVQTLR